jgi:hypothetical protein
MCRHCSLPSVDPARETRRRFLRRLATGLVVSAGLAGYRDLFAQDAVPQGSRTSWARLVTPHPYWDLHREQDTLVAGFIRREVRLNLDTDGGKVDPAALEQLTTHPFIYTNDLSAVVDRPARDNLREYLRRGGFFSIEACLDHRVTRGFGDYLARHRALFRELLPGTEIQQLLSNHAIFQSYFPVNQNQLGFILPGVDDARWQDAPQGLYGVYFQGRMISLLSLAHLQCEWETKDEKIPACLKQMANIYVYAMTR